MTLRAEAILFDLDGVLVDSSAVVRRHWRQWAEEHGIPFEDLEAVMHGRRSVEIIRHVAPHLDAEAEARTREAKEGQDTDGLRVFKQAPALLRSLPRERWGVVTSGNHATATTRLGYGDYPEPSVLITADDVDNGKPAPDGYLLGAERLGVDPSACVVVEDAPAGIKAAQAAGMRVIAVATTHEAGAFEPDIPVAESIEHLRIDARHGHLVVTGDA